MLRKFFWINFLILSFFILDRFLKIFFLSRGAIHKKFAPLTFFLFKNSKMVFGFFSTNFWFDIIVVIILLFLIFRLKEAYLAKNFTPLFAYTLIIIGALDNILDRIKYDFVIDYINLGPWHIFNLADLMILIGVIVILVNFFGRRNI
jgi:signal peptidase II